MFKVDEQEMTAANVIVYTLKCDEGSFEVCFSTYTDGTVRDVISGKFYWLDSLHCFDKIFNDDTLYGLKMQIDDLLDNRNIVIFNVKEDYLSYSKLMYFIHRIMTRLTAYLDGAEPSDD